QLLTESLLLSTGGALLGLLLASESVRLFNVAIQDVDKPYWIKFELDATVVLFVAAVCVLSSMLFGLLPALRTSRSEPAGGLKESGKGVVRTSRGWLQASLVVGELALAVILLAGAGLMVRSLFTYYSLQGGVDANNVMTARLSLPEAKYSTPESRVRFVHDLVGKLGTARELSASTLVSHSPGGGGSMYRVQKPGEPEPGRLGEDGSTAMGLTITPGYFTAVGSPLIVGRDFDLKDGASGQETVIVNGRFAQRHWPKGDAVGKRIRLFGGEAPTPWFTVIGISGDIRQNSPQDPAIAPVVYLPYRSQPQTAMIVLARTIVPPANATAAIRAKVQSVDPDLPISHTQTLEKMFEGRRWAYRTFSTLFGIFAAVALGMAAVGVYAVISYSVNQRISEIGLRMALGATGSDILRLVAGRSARQIGLGLGIGLAGAFAITRVISALLVQVSPTDPLTFGTTVFLLLAAGVAACVLPARRALSIQPLTALHHD
ncbi:MAG TPA: FtsX-like permease family protein, partial [Bryobacteraceae bacterium]|nr:FtsX-like permease family protein [Bryobacteraceae bacterium]